MFRYKKSLLRCLLICFEIIFISFLSSASVFAGTRTFIKEYTYQASEDDSRNSSRVIALREVKRLLLEELGTYLESETEVKNYQLTRDQITTLTAGIVQTEIIEEKWDGRSYWLKSKITADAEKVVQSIDKLRKDRDKTNELEAMRRKSDELLREVERLRKQMSSGNDVNRDQQKAAYDTSIKQLSAAEWIEKGHAVSGPHDQFKGAFDAYSRAIELDPNNIEAYYFRARISEKNQAMSDYYKILSIVPKNSEAHLIRAWTYKELNERDSALNEFAKAIENARGNKEMATAYHDRGRYYTLLRPRPYVKSGSLTIPNAIALSIHDFSKAIALDPKESSYYSSRADAYLGAGKYDLSINDFNIAIAMEPKSAGLYSARAHVFRFLNKMEQAAADFSRAIELDPESLFVTHDYMMRAVTYENLGKFDLAIRDWSKLIELKPKESGNYRARAENYAKLKKYDLAIKDYGKAVSLAPKEGALYYGRARIHALLKDKHKAIKDLTVAIQLSQSYKESARNEAAFDSVRQHADFIKLVVK
jgi:tetratricopeptide (TPR) repeat protein